MAKPNADLLTSARLQAFEKLNIRPQQRIILSLDGGGMRGILTIQLLKQLEAVADIPCYELVDMVAGTSTGAIIAGLIVTGHSAVEIERMYESLVTEVFDKRLLGNRFINPPAFSKKKYRKLLEEKVGDITLEEACRSKDIDLMITSKDMSAAEETFFSCFKQSDGTCYGTYKSVLLRSVMEATMSAPTYFYPLERFVDGGTTTYNNPALAAYIEAVSYSTPHRSLVDGEKAICSAYDLSKITLLSFGTGISKQFIKPKESVNPDGIDIKFWLNWLMAEMGQDASAMQVDAFRSPMMRNSVIDFRRFQISLDPEAIKKLPNADILDEKKYHSKWLHDLDEEILGNIDMADITRFDLMKAIGTQMAAYIMQYGYAFTKDMVTDRGRDLLVTASGDVTRIQKQMSDPKWLESFIA
ncbi:hypothetical protein BH10BAC2_BH10BAC2_31590 [soil metagenome]